MNIVQFQHSNRMPSRGLPWRSSMVDRSFGGDDVNDAVSSCRFVFEKLIPSIAGSGAFAEVPSQGERNYVDGIFDSWYVLGRLGGSTLKTSRCMKKAISSAG